LQKKKKLSKNISDEKRQKSEDQSWIANFEMDTTSAKKETQELKEKLEKEVKILGDIQEGLRDKTQGLQTQIEALQIKLDPYLEKINSISSQIGVASHERDIVDQAVNGGRLALEEAKAAHSAVLNRTSECRKELTLAANQAKQSKTTVSTLLQKMKVH
jgi:structural maintenance of chromosome 4